MPISPAARARIRELAHASVVAQKRTYAERLRRVLDAAAPPLSNAELSAGLELDERDVGRFLSTAARSATARPDGDVRATIDAILAGTLVVAVRRPMGAARRDVVVLHPTEARRLDRSWAILPLCGELGPRDDELEDDALWAMGEPTRPAARARREPDRRFLLGERVFPIALGTLRLGTEGRPDPEAVARVLRAAVDAGVEVFDTADSYALDEDDLGHVERAIGGAGLDVVVVTKAGLRRPGGRWVPDGSPERLVARCEASLRNLRRESLDLMLLHAVDPRVPLADSVGALRGLLDAGKCRAIGVCNVDAAQLEAAMAVAPIAAVQVEISRHAPKNLALAERCEALGIAVLAHRPLGGHARRSEPPDAAVNAVASRLGVSGAQVQLAWLLARAPNVIPLVGATRAETARDAADAAHLALDDAAMESLDRGAPTPKRRAPPPGADEVLLVTGPPGAGKTSLVEPYLARGYARLNRDELGGTLDGLVPRLIAGVAAGQRRWILDNTYPTRASRHAVLRAAAGARLPVRCVRLDTPLPEALYNACRRLITRYGRLPDPGELARGAANDVPPSAVHRWFHLDEPPTIDEGFASIERVPFVRTRGGSRRAVLLDLDGTVRVTRSGAPYPRTPDDVVLLPGRRERLSALHEQGWLLLGVSNQSGVGSGHVSAEAVEACFEATRAALGLPFPIKWCPHPPGRDACWCRKPMPGLGVWWIESEGLDREACVMVGDRDSDRAFAANLGVRFETPEAFFESPPEAPLHS